MSDLVEYYPHTNKPFKIPGRSLLTEEEARELALTILDELGADLTFAQYGESAQETAIYPDDGMVAGVPTGIIYTGFGLGGEAGEVQEKVKKAMRENDEQAYLDQLRDEMGDVLWYWAMLCYELGLDTDDVAHRNLEKLLDRYERGELTGQGDYR